MNFKLIPFTIEYSKRKKSFSILGFELNNHQRSIGFSWNKERDIYYTDTTLKLFLWGYIWNWYIKRQYDEKILQHKECNGAVYPESLYCSICDEYTSYEECNILTKEDL